MSNSSDASTSNSTQSVNQPQTLWGRAWETIQEAWPATATLPRLLAIDNMAKDGAMYRARLKDDHARHVAALNRVTGDNLQPTEPEEEMISVAGDTTTTVHNSGSKLAAAVAAAALPLAGIGAYLLWQNQPDTPAPEQPAATDRDTYVPYYFDIE